MNVILATALVLLGSAGAAEPINLADAARVVRFEGQSPDTLQVRELERGVDGWPVWTGEGGESMIGVEWDSPRELAQVEIEFRHAIADRDRIRVQYFLSPATATRPHDARGPDDTFHGRWQTARADWWAGDRFVGFSFLPWNEELPDAGVPPVAWRRTCRLRFLLGQRKTSFPAVRYLRAYGPAPCAEAAFDVRLDRLGPLRTPLEASVLNGLILEEPGGATTRSMSLESAPARLRVRFAAGDRTGCNRTIVTLTAAQEAARGFSFAPAEAADAGPVRAPALGVEVAAVGGAGTRPARRETRLSVFDRLAAGPTPDFVQISREILGGQSRPRPVLTAALTQQVQRYRAVLDEAMDIEWPDAVLNDFYRAQLVRLLAAADGQARHSEPVASADAFARRARPVASCQQARALEAVGLHAVSLLFLEACLNRQPPPTLAGRFDPDQKGVLGIPATPRAEPSEPTALAHGVLLAMLNEHYRFTRDRRWLIARAERLIRACDFITRQCRTTSRPSTLADDEDASGSEGLLPPGPIDGCASWRGWLAANACAARGMRLTAQSLADVNEPGEGRLKRDAADFERRLRLACRDAMRRCPLVRLADGQYVPAQPIASRLRGRQRDPQVEAVHGAVHLIEGGVYAPDAPEAEWILRDAEDNVLPAAGFGSPEPPADAAMQRRFLAMAAASPAGLPPLCDVYLDRGQYRHALRALYGLMAAHLAGRDLPAGTSAPAGLDSAAAGTDPPDTGATLLVWLRHLLVLEREREMDLLAGAPPEWLAAGRRIVVRRAPTACGPIDLTVESQADARRIVVQLTGPSRQVPDALALWVRAPRPLTSVTCNGQRLATFDPASGKIYLPVGHPRAEIVVDY